MGKKKPNVPTQIVQQTQNEYNRSQTPSDYERQFGDDERQYSAAANAARARQTADYGRLMGDYGNMYGEMTRRAPTKFTATRPGELTKAYGYLDEAMPGYRDFAATGGYSDSDVQELRARGMSPIRAAYGNTIRELDRARSLGGSGGAVNYIAARSRAQRELPGQMADAMTSVNANLADSIRQGKMFGLGGMTQTGSTMGGLADSEASRMLQAQGMTEQALQNWYGNRMGALNAQTGLYGTTPAMASTFGNQALQGAGLRFGAENSRRGYGLDALQMQLAANQQAQQQKGTPWWKKAIGFAAPYVASAISDRNMKEEISKPLDHAKIMKGIKKLNLHTWKYKGDETVHMGPMAQDVKKYLGVGDGKTIHLADIMGVMLATAKSEARA